MQHLEIVSPPAEEPVSLAEAKLHLRVEDDVTEDDSLITGLITAARMVCEARLRQTLILTTYDQFFDRFPWAGGGYYNRMIRQQGPGPGWLPSASDAVITLDKPPLVFVASVKYYDPTGALVTINSTNYFCSFGLGSRIQPVLGQVWPVAYPRMDAVVVRYSSGLPNAAAVPANVKAAIKLMVGNWYEHREEVADVLAYPVPNTVDALLSATDPGIYS